MTLRVIGESTIVDSMQYMHLGYVSATIPDPPLRNDEAFTRGGIVVLIIGAMVAVKYWRLSLLKSIVGVMLALFGIASVAYVIIFPQKIGGWKYANPLVVTSSHMDAAAYRLSEYRMQRRHMPKDIFALQHAYGLTAKEIQDGFRRDMRIGRVIADGHVFYSVISAGGDGKFGSKDDMFCGHDDANNYLMKVGEPASLRDSANGQLKSVHIDKLRVEF